MPRTRLWWWLCALLGIGACAVAPLPPHGAAGASASTPAAPLSGSRWVGMVEGVTDSQWLPRIEFAPGGRMTGYTGCNMMSGTWSEEAGIVRLGAIAATKRMCLGPGADIEKRVLAALGEGARVTRAGTRLVVTSPGGERFEFTPAAGA